MSLCDVLFISFRLCNVSLMSLFHLWLVIYVVLSRSFVCITYVVVSMWGCCWGVVSMFRIYYCLFHVSLTSLYVTIYLQTTPNPITFFKGVVLGFSFLFPPFFVVCKHTSTQTTTHPRETNDTNNNDTNKRHQRK